MFATPEKLVTRHLLDVKSTHRIAVTDSPRVKLELCVSLVHSRTVIKLSTPTTRMDTVQTRQVQDSKMERKSLQGQKHHKNHIKR